MNGLDDRWDDPYSFQLRKTDFGKCGGGWDADGNAGDTNPNGGWGGWNGGKKAASFNTSKSGLGSDSGGLREWKPERKSNFFALSSRELDPVDVPLHDHPPFEKNFYVEHPNVASMTTNEVAAYRKRREIVVEGRDVPKPICSFKEASFPDYVLEGVLKAGFMEPTAIQAQGWPMALKGRDLIGLAVTGSGKTLAYLLPAIVHVNAQPVLSQGDGPIILVLAPTRELALQIQQEAEKFGSSSKIKTTCVYGGASKGPQIRDLQKGWQVCWNE